MFDNECHKEDCQFCKSLIHNEPPPLFKSVADMNRYYGRIVEVDLNKPVIDRNFLGFRR